MKKHPEEGFSFVDEIQDLLLDIIFTEANCLSWGDQGDLQGLLRLVRDAAKEIEKKAATFSL